MSKKNKVQKKEISRRKFVKKALYVAPAITSLVLEFPNTVHAARSLGGVCSADCSILCRYQCMEQCVNRCKEQCVNRCTTFYLGR